MALIEVGLDEDSGSSLYGKIVDLECFLLLGVLNISIF
jgi:hypothetical protein